MKVYQKIESIIRSASTSTRLALVGCDYGVKFDGLNKRVSRQTAEIIPGHGEWGVVIILSKAPLIISQHVIFENELTHRELPLEHVEHVFKFPFVKPRYLENSKLIYAHIVDEFDGYDKEGKPVFSPRKVKIGRVEIVPAEGEYTIKFI